MVSQDKDRHGSVPGDRVVIVQFAKEPQPHCVKTRMMPYLTAHQALQLHKRLVTQTFEMIADAQLGRQELWVSANKNNLFFQQLLTGRGVACVVQEGADLGQRIWHAAQSVLKRAKQVIIIGSDCPFIDAGYLRQAIAALQCGYPVVIGPANDGGYVLLGLTQVDKTLFTDIEWGTERVMQQTEQKLRRLGWSWFTLESLDDIDRPEDLGKLSKDFVD